MSGKIILDLVSSTLKSKGINVYNMDLASTPEVEWAVTRMNAQGGIILTASHNPKQWNALKLLNEKGEFISAEKGQRLLELAEMPNEYVDVDQLGVEKELNLLDENISAILSVKGINVDQVQTRKFKVVVDAINSVGAKCIPPLLDKLGVEYIIINEEMTGDFAHNPEPLKKHLEETCKVIKDNNADMGIVVDPDVDRLAFIDENGNMFGEEYTIVAIADYLLSKEKGHVVSNLSSSRALRDVANKHGGSYSASAVGEVNVVTEMKATSAIFGGEGNGGVIVPELHYGRDSLVGIALFLSYVAEKNKSLSEIRSELPHYEMAKEKAELEPGMDVDALLENIKAQYQHENISTIDGVKIDFDDAWVHMRKSNTEPIIRIYTEATTAEKALKLAQDFSNQLLTVS
jgi:phosphomannomutase